MRAASAAIFVAGILRCVIVRNEIAGVGGASNPSSPQSPPNSAAAFHYEHEHMGPLNPALGTHGFPDCVQPGAIPADIDEAQMTMVCAQRAPAVAAGAPQPLKIACVGDSITAGAHASNASMGYPYVKAHHAAPARRCARNGDPNKTPQIPT